MVKHHATAATRFRNPVKQAIWDSLEMLRRPELDQLEAKVDGLIAEGVALAETRQPGVLAAALVAWVDRWGPRVYEIPAAVTDGRDILREWLADSPHHSSMHTAMTLAWPAIRDNVLTLAREYFASLAAGHRFVREPRSRHARTVRLTEKLWFVLRVLDRAAPTPSGIFQHGSERSPTGHLH